jgi:hypothetical protein
MGTSDGIQGQIVIRQQAGTNDNEFTAEYFDVRTVIRDDNKQPCVRMNRKSEAHSTDNL